MPDKPLPSPPQRECEVDYMCYMTGELRRAYDLTWEEMNDILRFMEDCGYLRWSEIDSVFNCDMTYVAKWPRPKYTWKRLCNA